MPSVSELTPLRVATYNLYLGADLTPLFDVRDADQLAERVAGVRAQLTATPFAERAVAVAKVLGRERPELVGLQEVARWTTATLGREGSTGEERVLADFLPTLLAALEDDGCAYDAHAVNPTFRGGLPVDGGWMGLVGANAVLVRRDGPVRVRAESTGVFAAAHRVVTGLEGLTFGIARGWGEVDAEVDGRPVRFVVTHTEAYDGPDRDRQRDELLTHLGDPGVPVVLVGDLNATPDRVGVPAPYVDAWTAAGNDPTAGPTCGQDPDLRNQESRLRDRIDYVFVRDAQVRGCHVAGDGQEDRSTPSGMWPSDHAAVVADLEV